MSVAMPDFLKKTSARVEIINFLKSADSPVDVGKIIEFLRSKNLNTDKATVYRTVDLFLSTGVIDRVEFGEGKFRYEIKKDDHHHLICRICGRVEDIADNYMQRLEKEIYKKRGFRVETHSLEFFGNCRKCQH